MTTLQAQHTMTTYNYKKKIYNPCNIGLFGRKYTSIDSL